MIKKLIVLLLISNCSLLYAQTIKTDVLVIGNGASAFSAAIQCARSKVKTVLVYQETAIITDTNKTYTIDENRNIPSGLWGEFRKQVQAFYKNKAGYDTTFNAPLKFELNDMASILKKMTDTLKNLTQYSSAQFISIKKDGDYWETLIKQNEKTITIKARVIIDATKNAEVTGKAGAKLPINTEIYKSNYLANSYRTAIATGSGALFQKDNFWYIPMSAVILKDADNILITEKALPADKSIQYLPMQLELGQGAGAIAAYCAFFKTNTQHLKVRIIQGELLDFKGYLLPFTDIDQKDEAWRAIQQICAAGLLKGKQTADNTGFDFMPDSLVTTAEIKPVLMEIYTRAFLWFSKEKPDEKFTVGNMLSLISDYTLTDPDLLKANMQKAWKTQYKFKPDFDLNRQITRREFAVLANKFLNPFARTVDLSGRIVN